MFEFDESIDTGAPRVEACIAATAKRFPGIGKTTLARYFEAVHQELAPLARDLERENIALREALQDAERQALERALTIAEECGKFGNGCDVADEIRVLIEGASSDKEGS